MAYANCFEELALLRESSRSHEVAVIDFYLFQSDRFINKDLNFKIPAYGKIITKENQKRINYHGRDIVLFHSFGNTTDSESYAATFGTSIVNVRLIDSTQESMMQEQIKRFESARSAGINVPALFSNFEDSGKFVLVFQYMHGPNLEQLQMLYRQGRIEETTWKKINSDLEELRAHFDIFKSEQGLDVHLAPEKIVYYDDQWYIIEF